MGTNGFYELDRKSQKKTNSIQKRLINMKDRIVRLSLEPNTCKLENLYTEVRFSTFLTNFLNYYNYLNN